MEKLVGLLMCESGLDWWKSCLKRFFFKFLSRFLPFDVCGLLLLLRIRIQALVPANVNML